jgi:hypothetical protein
VIAVKEASAVADGAPEAGYGPISLGATYQIPGCTSPECAKYARIAESPPWPSMTPGDGTAGERSPNPRIKRAPSG